MVVSPRGVPRLVLPAVTGSSPVDELLGVCPSNAILLRQTICKHLRRSRPEKILTVFQRIRLLLFRACGLASTSSFFASQRRITRIDS